MSLPGWLVGIGAKRPSWIKNRPLVCLLALVTGEVLVAMGLAPSAIAAHKRKPDLVVTKATQGGDPYGVQPFNAKLSVKDVTENKKKEGHDARAGASQTGLYLAPQHAGSHADALHLTSRTVPKLAPGDSDPGVTSDTVATGILPLGAYKVEVCADVKNDVHERNENNNCKRAGSFYVAQDIWSGSVDGAGADGSASGAETWHSSDAQLSIDHYAGNGVFVYAFTGTVTWSDDGVTTGGCKITGHGQKSFTQVNGINLDYSNGNYKGKVRIRAFYRITISPPPQGSEFCSPTPVTVPGPETREILNIPTPKDLKYDQNELQGSSPGGTPRSFWRWDFL
jgi:hypothetical protein